MASLKILVVGKSIEILNVLKKSIEKKNDWKAIVSTNYFEAEKLLKNHFFDLLLLSSGIEDEEENEIRNTASNCQPELKILQHYGGGSSLLYSEIEFILTKKTI